MSNALFGLGRHNYSIKQISSTVDTLKASLLTMSSAAGKIYLVTGASSPGNPIVLTVASTTGIATGDVLVVNGVGGTTSANGTWIAGTVTGTTVELKTKLDNISSTGNGAYTSGGWIIDLSSASTLADVSANSNGADVAITGVTDVLGVVNASPWTWSGLAATKSWGVAIYDSTAANDLLAWIDGYYQVYVITQAAASSTAIAVARLPVQIATGTVLNFSNGASATLSAQANVGDTSLAVTSTAAIITRQATADAPTLNAGLPVTPAPGGSLQLTPDAGVNKLYAL